MRGDFSLKSPDTLFPRRGRPKNPLITRLMAEGVSRATAFRRLKAKHKARLAKAARMGNGRDHLNQHPDGYYPTPPRGAHALLARESFKGLVWEPACGEGAISGILEAAGLEVITTDLVDRGYGRGGHDFLADNATLVDHIVTNPPYGPARGLSARFVEHALTRIRPGGTVCMLLRTNWEAPQRHRRLMARCCRKYTFSRRLEMHRGGYTGTKHSAQLDVSWYVFNNEHTGLTQIEVLPPDCGDVLPLAQHGGDYSEKLERFYQIVREARYSPCGEANQRQPRPDFVNLFRERRDA
jgi:hypothetical protein